MVNFMQRALSVLPPGEEELPRSPEGPAAATLYHAGKLLHVREGMTATEALEAVAGWLPRVPGGGGMCTATRGGSGSGGGDTRQAVATLVALLRRDMLASARHTPNAPTLAIMGLLVPVEVCALRRVEACDEWRVEFLALSADRGEVRVEAALQGVLEAADVDMVYALGPALAAFLASHGVASRHDLLAAAAAAALETSHGARPVVPACVLAPVQPAAADTHVARRLVHARLALLDCGYRVPTLGYIPLHGATLETWLQSATDGVRCVRDQMRRVDDMQRQLAKEMEDLVFLTRISGLHCPDPAAADAC